MTVWSAFCGTAKRWPERPFLNVLPETAAAYGIEAGSISYGMVRTAAEELSERLVASGYRQGHRVWLLLENRPAFLIWFLAASRLGVSVVPVNPDLRAAELAYMAGHAEPALAVAIPSRQPDLIAAGRTAGVGFAVIDATDDIPAPRGSPVAVRAGEAEAALLYTSGTTGQPKGCVLTDSYFTGAGRWYARSGGLCALTEDGERMLTPLPLFHMNALAYSVMAMIEVGGCLTVLDRFHPRTWWSSVRAARATCLHYLGVMPAMLMAAPANAADRDHDVRFGFGAGVPPELHAPFEARFGIPLVEGWAMTETGAGAVICANHPPRRVGEAALGVPEAGLQVRIVDEAGQPTDGGAGELLVRREGDNPRSGFFAEYYRDPDATAEAWQGGWFHTGDIVRQDTDGTMFFVDRRKNVIRRSGENIAAVEVESVLLRHPQVSAVGVTAVPDPVRGDEVFACVAGNIDPEGLVRWCLEQLAYYKAPGFVAQVEALPVTATQKIQRAELKALASSLLDSGAAHDMRALKKRPAA